MYNPCCIQCWLGAGWLSSWSKGIFVPLHCVDLHSVHWGYLDWCRPAPSFCPSPALDLLLSLSSPTHYTPFFPLFHPPPCPYTGIPSPSILALSEASARQLRTSHHCRLLIGCHECALRHFYETLSIRSGQDCALCYCQHVYFCPFFNQSTSWHFSPFPEFGGYLYMVPINKVCKVVFIFRQYSYL